MSEAVPSAALLQPIGLLKLACKNIKRLWPLVRPPDEATDSDQGFTEKASLKRLIGKRHCLVLQEGISFENRFAGLLPRIPETREGNTRAGLELEVDRKLLLGVFVPFVETVGPADQMTSYEVSPIPRAMNRAYSSALAILGNDIVVLNKLAVPLFRMISTIGDDLCLTVISTLDSRYVHFIVYWPPEGIVADTSRAYPSGVPIVVQYWTKIKNLRGKPHAPLVRSNVYPMLRRFAVFEKRIDVCMPR